MLQQAQFEDDNADYAAFVEKFKPKKTTDDCYTPANIYEAVLEWEAKKYGFDKSAAVRPFWHGADLWHDWNPPKTGSEMNTISQPDRGARRNAETTEAIDPTHSAVRKGCAERGRVSLDTVV